MQPVNKARPFDSASIVVQLSPSDNFGSPEKAWGVGNGQNSRMNNSHGVHYDSITAGEKALWQMI